MSKWFLFALIAACLGGASFNGSAAILFQDDFSGYSTGATPDNPPWSFARVSETGGNMVNTVSASGDLKMALDSGSSPTSYGFVNAAGSQNWSDYIYSADVRRNTQFANLGIMGRFTNYNNTYRLWFSWTDTSTNSGKLILDVDYKGTVYSLASADFTMARGASAWYTFQLAFEGSNITGSVIYQGATVASYSVTDTRLATGSVGVFRNSGNDIEVDNVLVASVPEASTAMLSLFGIAILAMARRKFRCSMKGAASALLGALLVLGIGTEARAEKPLFSEDFSSFASEALPTPPWVLAGTLGNPNAIAVAEGELKISSHESNPFAIIGDEGWKNYLVSIDLKRNNPYSAAGIVGRYKDAGHFYRLIFVPSRSWDQTGELLLQKFDGHLTSLAKSTITMQAGQWYRFTLKFEDSGTVASVHRDDELIQTLEAAENTEGSGKVGVSGAWSSNFSATRILVKNIGDH